jgi:ABC-type branched-subunit amino acid transport system substrate-binding protein
MKHIIMALAFSVLLAACVSSGNPWDYSSAANRPAEQAPRALAKEDAQDPRLAYYRDLQNGMTPEPDMTGQPGAPGPLPPYAQPDQPGVTIGGTGYAAVKPAAPPVKVALLVPLSGPQSELGQAMLQSAQLALFDMGLENFELMPRDTGTSTDGARQATISAINDGAQLILGPVFADGVRAAKPIAQARGVNMVVFSTDWTLAGGNTFVMGFLPFGQVQRVADYGAAHGMRRIGILAPDNDYGNAVVNAYNAAAQAGGLPPASVTRFRAEQADLSPVIATFSHYEQRMAQIAPQLAVIEAALKINPNDAQALARMDALKKQEQSTLPYDAVLLPVGGERASAIADLLHYYEMDGVQLLGTGLWDDQKLAADPQMRGALFAAPQPDLRASFERNYRNTYGGMQPPRLATLAYDATALAVVLARNSIQATGQPRFDYASITNPNGFAGIDGIFRFRPDGLVERGQAVLQIGDHDIAVVDRAPNTFQTRASLPNGM